jgi:hypothetical protein
MEVGEVLGGLDQLGQRLHLNKHELMYEELYYHEKIFN